MLHNAVLEGFIGPIDYREQVQKLVEFQQRAFIYGKLVLQKQLNQDKQSSIQLVNLKIRTFQLLKFDVKNFIFNRGIKYVDGTFVKRGVEGLEANHDKYQLLLQALEGNENMQEFVKMYYLN